MIDIKTFKALLKSIVIIFVIAFAKTASSTVIDGIDTGHLTEDLDQNIDGFLETGGLLNIVNTVADSTGFIAEESLNGNSVFTIEANGNWRYSANNYLAKIQSLAAGEVLTEVFTVTSTDGATHDVVITITGSNDTAVITGDISGSVKEDIGLLSGKLLKTQGKLIVTDADANESAFVFSRISGNYGMLFINDAGDWAYYVDNNQDAIQRLVESVVLTEVFTVRTTDGTTHDVVITINGSNDAAVIAGGSSGSVKEDNGQLTGQLLKTQGKLIVADANKSAFVFSRIIGDYGVLYVNATGDWVYFAENDQDAIQKLAESEVLSDVLTVVSTDGVTHDVVITITSSNGAAVITGDSSGSFKANAGLQPVNLLKAKGKLTITDADDNESAFVFTWISGNYGVLFINTTGDWVYYPDNNQYAIQRLVENEVLTEVITVRSTDGTTHDIVITITGSNDPPVITGDSSGSVKENTGLQNGKLLKTQGKLNITDVDANESAFVFTWIGGNYGALFINAAGDWAYYADNNQDALQSLSSGEVLSEVLTVSSVDGTAHAIVITIEGSDAVNLSWQAPVSREDDTSITLPEIAGYKIYYGMVPGQYDSSIDINGSSNTSYTFTTLDSSKVYYAVITCIDTEGRESSYSAEHTVP